MAQLITVDPEPPISGQPVTICYVFDGTGLDAVLLEITFTPPGTQDSVEVTKASPCVTITVPEGAESVTIDDGDGPSDEYDGPIE